ncbi:MAG TPA: DUF2066 domain-containing protein [Steroidobacteraceae bacterium]|nr:DUF2066 domain-containing protein [Steroidobacteraceae bacterium]HQR48701.1 DUF2066 domain-containing protein [Steroidobacteraceae bacterium]
MLRQPRTTTPGGAALRVVACVLFLAASLRAGADVAVYQAVVPLAGTTEADRNAAFGDALRTAAVRATGQRDAGSAPAVAAAAADPTRYVQQYSTTPDRMLKVGFDARAMDRLLQQAGLPFWPLERPVTLVLLVVPSVAGGQRAVLASERVVPERVELERAALARGLPIAWPEQPVSAAQVRAAMGGDDGAVGDSQYVLAGVGSGGSIAWRFTGVGESARVDGAPRDGADLAADALAARYAPASSRGTSTVAIRVGGIADVRSYASLLEYLKSLSLVRAVGVSGLDDREVLLDVTLRGDLGQLRRIAALDSHLKPAAATQGEVTAADFTYQP